MTFKCVRKARAYVFVLLALFALPAAASANEEQPAGEDPGYCFKVSSHVLQEYMLSVVFDASLGEKVVSMKVSPVLGKIVEGHIPLRNWTTTLTEDFILFEKTSEGNPQATIGFMVGIKYDKTVDYLDVEMIQETDDGTTYIWGGESASLPYQKAFRVQVPSVDGVALTDIPLDENFVPCYNEDYIPQIPGQNKAFLASASVGVLALLITAGYLIVRRARLR